MSKQWPLVFRQGTIFNFDGHVMGNIIVNRDRHCAYIKNCTLDADSLREIADYLDKCDKE